MQLLGPNSGVHGLLVIYWVSYKVCLRYITGKISLTYAIHYVCEMKSHKLVLCNSTGQTCTQQTNAYQEYESDDN